jgi:hypothetical protein
MKHFDLADDFAFYISTGLGSVSLLLLERSKAALFLQLALPDKIRYATCVLMINV